ncbi:hypothetical protein ACFOUP_13120 [Belliella kenyensis]|uniref:TonB-dependent receptor n=1 Tax=Belliella kenyensis TaxID=1472724 RepID=A0ABV8ENR3_9BACT|nr:hypothetical protein [Belliella kenyensis]MCH7403772.1 hypothetical protein [Belliella kenyensis]MDN3602444.1 hypothetical protein [Belliella kenyensis]
MKHFLLSILFFVYHFSVAQSLFQGRIQDADGKPIPFASFQIFQNENSPMLGYAISDSMGDIAITIPDHEQYFVKIRHLSFEAYNKLFDRIDLPRTFVLEEKTNQLESVVIEANKSAIRVNGDTLDYNLDLFLSGRENKLKDVLKKLPGIDITPDGKILANGKPIEDLLVEGETVFGQNHSILLETLNAEIVGGVQILSNYEKSKLLRGLENNENVAINIAIKEEFKGEFSGELGLDVSTGNRGGGYMNLYRFDLKSRLAVIGDFNNMNKHVLSSRDYADFRSDFLQDNFSIHRNKSKSDKDVDQFHEENERFAKKSIGLAGTSYGAKLNEHLDLKTFVLWSNQNTFQDLYLEREFLNEGVTSLIDEDKRSERRNSIFQTFLNLEYQKNKTQFNYDLVVSLRGEKIGDSLSTNFVQGILVNLFQEKENYLNEIQQQVRLTKKVGERKIMHSQFFHKLSQNTNNLFIDSEVDLFDRGFSEIDQLFRIKKDDLGGYFLYRVYKGNSVFGVYTGADFQRSELNIDNSLTDYVLSNTLTSLFVGSNYKKTIGDFKFGYDLKVKRIYNLEDEDSREQQWAILPFVDAKYSFTPFHTIQADFERTIEFSPIQKLVTSELFTDYRNINIGSNILFFEPSYVNEFNFNHNYMDFYHGLFVFSFFKYTNQNLVFTSSNDFRGVYNEIDFQIAENDSRKIAGNMVELRFSGLPVSFKTTNAVVNINSKSYLRGQLNTLQVWSFETKNELKTRFSNKAPNISGGLIVNSTQAQFSLSSQSNKLVRIEPFMEIDYDFREIINFNTSYRKQLFNSEREMNNLSIWNVKLSYKKETSDWSFGIMGNDVLNLRSSSLYEVSNTSNQLIRSVFSRFPGYFGIRVSRNI